MTLHKVAILILCISALLIGGCQEGPEKSLGPPAKVRIGVARTVLVAPVVIAMEKGFFAEEGLELTVEEYPFGKPALEAIFAGEGDMATVADIPVILNSFKRDDFLILAMFGTNEDGCKLVARRDSGISKPADLKGRKIGTTLGTTAQFFLSIFLNYHGLLETDVRLVDLPQTELPAAIANGKVDAVAVFEPYAFQALRLLGERAVRFPQTGLYRETALLTADRHFAEKNPETIKRVLRGIDRAVTFIHQNTSESQEIISKKFKLDEKFLHESWGSYVFALSLDQSLIITLEDEAHWAIKNRLTDKQDIPNYLHFIDQEALRQVRPEAVTIIR